ncbi:MAG: uridine diphosphate-N-acetylglucosamine-binding protein YvcK [Clostridium sp.]|nr:uridine diphosphate-N-acetylglucosamine-binding protein YvcK [Clostridium sp.]MCM1443750.1 uridine diphosphate-N-acetylglucosamine-binding protein YvcK [Candidatus Amulumruptor caecigallinarius]
MNKKVVVLGGGNGMSSLLRGLKQFPIDLTAIVTVSDDGKSTGILRKEFNSPALGDIRRVLISLSETEPLFEKMFNYRFQTDGYLNGHAVGNFLLQAMTDITGSVSEGIEALSGILNLKGKVIPLTENADVTLVATMTDNSVVEGEHFITQSKKTIKNVYYKKNPKVTKKTLTSLKEADLIILSVGSLYTSIIPNLIPNEVKQALEESSAKIMYVCNIVTQPGETDDFTVSDHIRTLNEYLGNRKVDVVIVNDGHIDVDIAEKYQTLEQKDPVLFDKDNVELLGVEVISGNFIKIENDILRHDMVKVALNIFTYLL